MPATSKRTCLECDREVFGRIDKKFCSDQCRTQNYNRANSKSNNIIRTVNAILKKNHKILQKLNPKGKAKVSETKLLENGFKLDYYTNQYTTKKGVTYKFCYDQGFIKMDNGYYAIFEKVEFE
jgi:predicted nucleic acid-binding Zn ribbon protein